MNKAHGLSAEAFKARGQGLGSFFTVVPHIGLSADGIQSDQSDRIVIDLILQEIHPRHQIPTCREIGANQGAIVPISSRRVKRDTEVLQNVQCRLIFFCRTIVRHVTRVDHNFWARIEGIYGRYDAFHIPQTLCAVVMVEIYMGIGNLSNYHSVYAYRIKLCISIFSIALRAWPAAPIFATLGLELSLVPCAE